MSWIDLTPELTEEGIERLNVGEVLFFNYEGSEITLKIMRKARGKVWAKSVIMYKPDEVEVEDTNKIDKI
jgi:hypothetical protein